MCTVLDNEEKIQISLGVFNYTSRSKDFDYRLSQYVSKHWFTHMNIELRGTNPLGTLYSEMTPSLLISVYYQVSICVSIRMDMFYFYFVYLVKEPLHFPLLGSNWTQSKHKFIRETHVKEEREFELTRDFIYR